MIQGTTLTSTAVRRDHHEEAVILPRSYYVYVIEVLDAGRRVFYVGQSGKTPEERLRQHRATCTRYCDGCRCSRHYVKGKVKGLRYELFARYNPLASRAEAERVERWLARKLRGQGYEVRGGH